ncbi:exopolyphosphatase [Denitromonas iodatirespirans]|uniref:Exopolyphosphatase n=1 Tax=Denitromonas iodatirespirans TaxID=2795389 RepID=A0A944DBH0_DENI1|nr:exopolyphosphatase [Denitromonas iodatirespirans]MBT0961996.1 exopolyphosphatase [Denitromonas iodatirespirans]
MPNELIAAIDLGSNSFRLQVGRIVNDQIYPLDGLKEPVRLAAGLSPEKYLDSAAQARGTMALSRFRERLAGFKSSQVRAVATNTLRVAKNAPEFLIRAEAALGFPIEVIAGREEARLIYIGVAHSLADPQRQQLVVDIGGGSTEFVIGRAFEPLQLESLYMGCVSFSMRYFPDGRIDRRGFNDADLAAQRELQTIVLPFTEVGWELAVGSSGTAKSLSDILRSNGYTDGRLTLTGLEKLRTELIKAGHLDKLSLGGIKADRLPVLPGGLAIMIAVLKAFKLKEVAFSEGALRLGVLYDLLGRYHHHDLRDATVQAFASRYQIDRKQADRVADTAGYLFGQLDPAVSEDDLDRRYLQWAALLHEIGISVAHSSYHKHSAYILGNADMPGFSRMDQARLARLVLAHRGKLARIASLDPASSDWLLIACLRLAVVFHRARDARGRPPVGIQRKGSGFAVTADKAWLDSLPLTAAMLADEVAQWSALGHPLTVTARAGFALTV